LILHLDVSVISLFFISWLIRRELSCPVGETSSKGSEPSPQCPTSDLRGTSSRRYNVPETIPWAVLDSWADICAQTARGAHNDNKSAMSMDRRRTLEIIKSLLPLMSRWR